MKSLIVLVCAMLFGCSVPQEQVLRSGETNRTYGYKKSFLPENNFAETRRYYAAGEVTEDDFNLAMDAANEIYQPVLSALGLNLTIQGNYSDETVNAYCSRDGDNVTVQMFGGLAKQPAMTLEGFVLVICHELGHAVAGIPKYANNDWAAVEGQSDYFATAACARKMFDPNSPVNYQLIELMKKNPKQPANCSTYRGADKQVCELSLSGGLSLGAVLASLNDEPTPKYETPSKVVVKKTMEAHPPAQCRLDSYKAGALCNKTWNDSIIPSTKAQENAVNCERPKCWYKA